MDFMPNSEETSLQAQPSDCYLHARRACPRSPGRSFANVATQGLGLRAASILINIEAPTSLVDVLYDVLRPANEVVVDVDLVIAAMRYGDLSRGLHLHATPATTA